jgi:MerR family transcriptional regulator, redox-sensitive transcriptional activator SoxR
MQPNGQPLLAIGEVARRAGVRPSAIRFYEAAGLLPPPARRVGGQRRYDPGILQSLAVIHLAQQAGFTISEIRELLRGLAHGAAPSAQWRALAERKLPEIRALIRRAQEMQRWLDEGLRCDCLELGACRLVDQAAAPLRAVPPPERDARRPSGWQRQKQADRAQTSPQHPGSCALSVQPSRPTGGTAGAARESRASHSSPVPAAAGPGQPPPRAGVRRQHGLGPGARHDAADGSLSAVRPPLAAHP